MRELEEHSIKSSMHNNPGDTDTEPSTSEKERSSPITKESSSLFGAICPDECLSRIPRAGIKGWGLFRKSSSSSLLSKSSPKYFVALGYSFRFKI